jgi:hypothetical protein
MLGCLQAAPKKETNPLFEKRPKNFGEQFQHNSSWDQQQGHRVWQQGWLLAGCSSRSLFFGSGG